MTRLIESVAIYSLEISAGLAVYELVITKLMAKTAGNFELLERIFAGIVGG